MNATKITNSRNATKVTNSRNSSRVNKVRNSEKVNGNMNSTKVNKVENNDKKSGKKRISKREICKRISHHFMVRANLISAIASAVSEKSYEGFCNQRIRLLKMGKYVFLEIMIMYRLYQ